MGDSLQPLPPKFYNRDTVLVARDLLGRVLCHDSGRGLTAGIVVET
ncbi:MAG: 3-methyladenine DNA glycosylase, partial [Firmicutes bacterium]|nr:3-methyladenine DNA glycosylase [Bacillota bacterium]